MIHFLQNHATGRLVLILVLVTMSGLTVGYYLLILVGILAFARKGMIERSRTAPMYRQREM